MQNSNIENNINETNPSFFEKGLNVLKKGSFYLLLPLTLLQYSCGDDFKLANDSDGKVYLNKKGTLVKYENRFDRTNKTFYLKGSGLDSLSNSINFEGYKIIKLIIEPPISKKRTYKLSSGHIVDRSTIEKYNDTIVKRLNEKDNYFVLKKR